MSSSDLAVRVRGLGKSYTIAHQQGPAHNTLAEQMLDWVRHPLRRSAKETFWALRDVEFDIPAGEVVGIVGRNGAGKSTLLKILSRITEPTAGTIDLVGRVGSLLEVGTGFHPELTGRENVFLNGAILGMTKAEIRRQFDAIVDFAGVEQFLDTPVKRYSSGMYVRLAFAVAAHLSSDILIIDEVLAVGDAEFQKKCLGKMHDVSAQGRTVLFVSHNMSAVESLCSSVILLRGGKVVRQTPDVRLAVAEYMNGPDTKQSEWRNADGKYQNDYFYPTRFFLSDEAGLPLPPAQSNDADVWIQLEGEVTTPDSGLTVGYALFNENGDCLYWSYHTDGPPECWPRVGTGKVVLRSPLPKRLLNHGTYRVELIGGLTNRQWLFEPGVSAPSVNLEISGRISNSPLYLAPRPTILAPLLDWSARPAAS